MLRVQILTGNKRLMLFKIGPDNSPAISKTGEFKDNLNLKEMPGRQEAHNLPEVDKEAAAEENVRKLSCSGSSLYSGMIFQSPDEITSACRGNISAVSSL
jgi:hypothetical protein